MDEIWVQMHDAARAVQRPREVNDRVYAGGVAAAVQSTTGAIYTGVCVDTSCTLGICAERSAILAMLTAGDDGIRRVLAVMPDGTCAAPCGACRELMAQIMAGRTGEVEVMVDYEAGRVATLADLTPNWWL